MAHNYAKWTVDISGVGLTEKEKAVFVCLSIVHTPATAALRMIAEILHDAMPKGNAWGTDEKKKIFRAHAVCRRLAELFACPK